MSGYLGYDDDPDFGAYAGVDDVDAAARQAAYDIVQQQALQETIRAQGLQAQAAVKQLEALDRQEQERYEAIAGEAYETVAEKHAEFKANQHEFSGWLAQNPELLKVESTEQTAESLDRAYRIWYEDAVAEQQAQKRNEDHAFITEMSRAAKKTKLSGDW